jgi:hypothetical protein
MKNRKGASLRLTFVWAGKQILVDSYHKAQGAPQNAGFHILILYIKVFNPRNQAGFHVLIQYIKVFKRRTDKCVRFEVGGSLR